MTGLNAQIKINNADWYEEIKNSPGGGKSVRPSSNLNRPVVCLDRKSTDSTEFLQRLANDKELLSRMEDSGEWSYTSRVPIAPGVSVAEGSQKSWDMDEGKVYTSLKNGFLQESGLKITTLKTQMHGLRNRKFRKRSVQNH